MTIWYILFTVLFNLVSAQCPATLYDSSIVTRVVNLITLRSSSPTHTFTHTFQTPFPTIPQMAAGLSSFQINPNLQAAFSQFWLIPSISLTDFKIATSRGRSSWQIGRLVVIVSANSELYLDLASSSIQNTGTYQFKSTSNKPNNFNNPSAIIIRTFLAGFNSTTNINYLLLHSAMIQNNVLYVNINVAGQSNLTLLIAVVIFPRQTASFVIYGNTVVMNTTNTRALDLFSTLSAAQHVFYGVNGIKVPDKGGLVSFASQIGTDFVLKMALTGQASFQLNYFFLGNSAETVCSKCQLASLGSIYFEGYCVSRCPPLTVGIRVGNGKVCRRCPSALNLGYSAGKCVQCGNDTIATDGICVSKITQTIAASTSSLSQGQTGGSIIINKVSSQQSSPNLQNQTTSSTSLNTSTTNPLPLAISNSQPTKCPLPNMFWNGDECRCIVGYNLVANICTKIIMPIIQPRTLSQNNQKFNCTGPNQYYNGTSCNCLPGYFYLNGNCTICPPNSILNDQQCACIAGYYSVNSTCIKNKTVSCPNNSKDNGQGTCLCLLPHFTLINNICVCQPNYRLVNNTCRLITCETLQIWNGSTCICDSSIAIPTYNTYNANGSCMPRCTSTQRWSQPTQLCVNVCGLYQRYDTQQQKCICIDGYAYGRSNECLQCQSGFYAYNGYCVTCPSYSIVSNNSCICQDGYVQLQDGTCRPRCSDLQLFNEQNAQCECMNGLARINRTCTPCLGNTYLNNGRCMVCPNNSLLIGGRCICLQGYIPDPSGTLCVRCTSLNNYGFNGFCIRCPGNLIYDNMTNLCGCPQAMRLSNNNMCISECREDQIYDESYGCYSCGLNMVNSGGRCVCAKGYVDDGCGCKLNCASNQFIYAGVCAQCPPTTIYIPLLQGCVCQDGHYFSQIFMQCILSPIIITKCKVGQYLDINLNKCLTCQANCYNCTSSLCVECVKGYKIGSNLQICENMCGDGMIVKEEQCDTGLLQHPGCISCNVAPGYTCHGQPSICRESNNTAPVIRNDSLSMKTTPQINTNNVFITLITTPTFNFPDETTMKSFIQAEFPKSKRPNMYCIQQGYPYLNVFDCLLIYASGIPNTIFSINFSYNYQGHAAKLTISVNPHTTTSSMVLNRQI